MRTLNIVKDNRSHNTRPKRPFIQGNLDGYCGIYSIVNAIHYLCGPISKTRGNELLYEGLKRLEAKQAVVECVIDGMSGRDIRAVLDGGISKQYGLSVKKPFHCKKSVPLDVVWNHMAAFLKNNHGVIVLGLEGKHNHWSLVNKVTDKSLLLFDSSHRRYLPKRNCTTCDKGDSQMHYISPTHLIYLNRHHHTGGNHE